MNRLVLVVPNVDTARKIVADLLMEGLDKDEIHIIAKEGIVLEGLPEAGLTEKTDLIPAMKRGLAAGSATGLIAGLAAVLLPTGLIAAGGAVLLASTLAGAAIGTWTASMIGVSVPSEEVKKYQQAIEAGKLLLLVDAPKPRSGQIIDLIRKHHPEAEIKEIEYSPPVLPEMPDE